MVKLLYIIFIHYILPYILVKFINNSLPTRSTWVKNCLREDRNRLAWLLYHPFLKNPKTAGYGYVCFHCSLGERCIAFKKAHKTPSAFEINLHCILAALEHSLSEGWEFEFQLCGADTECFVDIMKDVVVLLVKVPLRETISCFSKELKVYWTVKMESQPRLEVAELIWKGRMEEPWALWCVLEGLSEVSGLFTY